MKIRYLSVATRDLTAIRNLIAADSPRTAADVLVAVRAFLDLLVIVPDAGRLVGRGNIRVAVVPRLPYLIYYRPLPAELRIPRVRHGRRRPLSWT